MAAPTPVRTKDAAPHKRIDERDLEANPTQYIDRARDGVTFVLYRGDTPIAELRPARKPRSIGWAKGEFTVTPEFFEPLPDDLQKLYQGE